MKKALALILMLLLSVCAFADSYSIRIVNAGEMTVSEDVVVLSGDVRLRFSVVEEQDGGSADEKGKTTERELSAAKVVIDLNGKTLEAAGSVSLKEGKDSTFEGEALSLDWESLDVLVFAGKSSTERSNAGGTKIKFYSSGETISYAGTENIVFYSDGIIATREEEPYWSVTADSLALLESDLFFQNAVIRIGRVPVFWLPVFFYPGTRLSFNPAVGLSSARGVFMNTTTEIYGKYPGIGAASSTSSSDSGDSSADLASVFSFLSTDEKTDTIRDGIIYRSVKEGETLSDIETWARKTNSYLAVMADAYAQNGLAAGYDTKNVLFDSKLTLASKAMLAYRSTPMSSSYNYGKFRYYFNVNADYKIGKTSFSLKMPMQSDPNAQLDFLNRNTVFGLDSVFGSNQNFPSSYTSQTTYEWSLSASTTHTVGNYTFTLNDLKADADYKWDSTENKYKITKASVPSVSVSSRGTFFSLKGKSRTETEDINYSSTLAGQFSSMLEELAQAETEEGTASAEQDLFLPGITAYSGPKLQQNSTTVKAGAVSLGYTFEHKLNNNYKEDFERDQFDTKVSGSLDFKANTPGQWFDVSQSVVPVYSYKKTASDEVTGDFKLQSKLNAKVPFLGLTYVMNYYIFTATDKKGVQESHWGEWNKTDVTDHYLSLSRKVGDFTLGAKYTMKPLAQTLVPSVSYSMNGIVTAAADVTLYLEDNQLFKKGKANARLAIKPDRFNLSVSGVYDFAQEGWSGLTEVRESFTLYLLEKRLMFTQNVKLHNQFEMQTFDVGVAYGQRAGNRNNSAILSFKDKDFSLDQLKVNLGYVLEPVYFWRNRIGLESSMKASFVYDFNNKYSTSLSLTFSLDFAIYDFLDLKLSVTSVNNGFYNYYDETGTKFMFSKMWEDLLRSFDFFKGGRKNTQFNLSSLSVSAVHYMKDWNLCFSAKANVITQNSKRVWKPEVSIYVQWNAIPELKVENTWDKINKWSTK